MGCVVSALDPLAVELLECADKLHPGTDRDLLCRAASRIQADANSRETRIAWHRDGVAPNNPAWSSDRVYYEWMRGCPNTFIFGLPPWKCRECTEVMMRAMKRAMGREEKDAEHG